MTPIAYPYYNSIFLSVLSISSGIYYDILFYYTTSKTKWPIHLTNQQFVRLQTLYPISRDEMHLGIRVERDSGTHSCCILYIYISSVVVEKNKSLLVAKLSTLCEI